MFISECSAFVKASRVSLVSKHTDANLWHVDICMTRVLFIYPSFMSISAMVFLVMLWYSSDKYSFRLIVHVLIP